VSSMASPRARILADRVRFLSRWSLLIVDDLGYLPLSSVGDLPPSSRTSVTERKSVNQENDNMRKSKVSGWSRHP